MPFSWCTALALVPQYIQFKLSKAYSFKVFYNTCTGKNKFSSVWTSRHVPSTVTFLWLQCWQCQFCWQRHLFHCLLFQWIWLIYGSNCSAISGCRIERSFSARFFSCKSPLVSSFFQRSIRRYVFSTVSLYSFSISW